MIRPRRAAVALLLAAVLLATAVPGCGNSVEGTATWPGARLERAVLTAADFPPGVHFDRIIEVPGKPDGTGAPTAMVSVPEGCSDGLTKVISATAERGPGSAAEYTVGFDGARILLTVLTWPLDLDALAATAERCASFDTFFDRGSRPIPMTTTRLETARPAALVYEQTMDLDRAHSSIYYSFENVGDMAVFGIALPGPNPSVPVKATLPQTFLDVTNTQAQRLELP